MKYSKTFIVLFWFHLCLTIILAHPLVQEDTPKVELLITVDINPCNISENIGQILVDCSSRSLEYIHQTWFPESTREILLQSNLLTFVPNNTLNNLYILERLSLQYNLLTSIQPKAFEGLYSLQYLNLEQNRLQLFSLPTDVFSDLITLKELRLMQADTSYGQVTRTFSKTLRVGSFPDNMFRTLTNLTLLTVTASGNILYFNEEFDKLNHLNTVVVTGALSIVDEKSFKHVPNVRSLSLNRFDAMTRISDLALAAFQNITDIRYDNVNIGLNDSLKTLRPLVNSNVDSISFERVQISSSKYVSLVSKDGFLDSRTTQYLLRICVRELRLVNCDIFVIQPDAFKSATLDRCLRTLYIFNNPVIGSIFGLFSVLSLSSVNMLVLTSSFATRYGEDSDAVYSSDLISALSSVTLDANITLPKHHRKEPDNSSLSVQNIVNIYISRSMNYLDLSRLFGSFQLESTLRFIGGENLLHLRMKQSGISLFEKSPIGLIKLKNLYLSYNHFDKFNLTFFDTYPALEVLALDNCQIDGPLMSQHSYRVFQNLPMLQTLDLSFNYLDMLSPKTFSTCPNLTSLNIAGNRFRNLPIDLKLTPNLKLLDIRQNALNTIDASMRKDLDEKIRVLGEFRLLMAGNILSCGCEDLSFLKWLQETRVELDGHRNFTCVSKQGVLSSTFSYVELDGLWRECWGQFFFNISIGLLCVTFLGYILFFTWIKNKTFLQSSILQLFTDFKIMRPSNYRSGVYLGYADSDYQFSCSELRQFIEEDVGLTTFIRHRDLLPSCDIAQGVMEAINSSWRVLLVVNERCMHQDDWFLFTIRAAIYSISPANPSRVVVLVKKSYVQNLPKELLCSIPNDNIIMVSEWSLTYELKQALRTRLL